MLDFDSSVKYNRHASVEHGQQNQRKDKLDKDGQDSDRRLGQRVRVDAEDGAITGWGYSSCRYRVDELIGRSDSPRHHHGRCQLNATETH